ncbi:MAG: dihydrolipoyl dehydrogenase [Eubacteriales bacterium]
MAEKAEKAADMQLQNGAYDVAVIGGGPGGYVCAIRCAQFGKKTVLVEKRELGGTCLNRGCIPTKALLHTAELFEEMRLHGDALGIQCNGLSIDYAATSKRKNEIVKKLRNGVAGLVSARKITLVGEEAVLTGKNTFTAGGREYRAERIILATGSEPAAIPVLGADKKGVMNSDQVLEMEKLPESCVIIGGGVIGIEFASLMSAFEKKVTVIEMLPRILNEMDEDISATAAKLMQKKGVEIHTGAKLLEIKDGLVCVYEENGIQKEAAGEIVIMAVGRRPVLKALNLQAAGVAAQRFVEVDEKMQTNVPGIYAIGDITGKLQLAHVASAQGLVAAANACGGNKKMQYNIVPACIYTNPEIASVGMTEAQVKAAGIPYKTGSFAAAGNGRSMIMNCPDGFVKILSHRESGEILGAHMIAPRATDMIGEIAVAMKAEATIEEIADTIHAHPTVSEMIMEAAHDTEGLCCHKLR